MTAPRLAVLAVVEQLGGHVDAATIAAAARDRLGSVSTPAVYEILNALTDAGLLRRIQPAGSPARYETRVGDNHHHLVCRTCGAVEDVECVVGSAPCLHAGAERGASPSTKPRSPSGANASAVAPPDPTPVHSPCQQCAPTHARLG